jgi:hypothetical protein
LSKLLRLSKIDSQNRGDHSQLDVSDEGNIYFWREYTARKDYSFSETNQRIKNFKITPAAKRANPQRGHHKENALQLLAGEVSKFIVPSVIKGGGTIVPIPPSKIVGDPDHDDRIMRLLKRACTNHPPVDIRQVIVHSQNVPADHEGTQRLSFTERLNLTSLDTTLLNPISKWVVIFDDVLTNGTHYKVAKHLLSAAWPGVPITGVFIARRVQPPIDFEAEFSVIED